ncbi:MAG TPA: TRAP transporter small permease subunit [Pseudolabrys sp.]|jgi:TRAP-type C4-dicarboxylate transport system permease small subunit|nr:TRAP transporter small permease subunit [Pseudolabrys sp.]
MLSRALSGLEWALNFFAALLVAVILVSVCAQVVMRYGFNNATTWSDPIASAAMAWLTFVAMAVAERSDSNMSVRFTWNWVGPRGRKVLELVVLLLTAIFAIAVSASAWELMEVTKTALVEGLPIDITWAQMYGITLVSGAFIVLVVIERLLKFFAGDAR